MRLDRLICILSLHLAFFISTLILFFVEADNRSGPVGSGHSTGPKGDIILRDNLPTDAPLSVEVKFKPEKCDRKSKKGDKIHVHYTARLYSNGKEIGNTMKRGKAHGFILGSGKVIQGWEMGLLDMCVGEKRNLVIPSGLAYGNQSVKDDIPAGSTLIFNLTLAYIEAVPTDEEIIALKKVDDEGL